MQGRGLAIAGLVLGYLGIVAIPFILIIAAIAIPNLLRAKIAANEASAAHSVRTVATAERAYAAQHPTEGFTCNLADLNSAGLSDSDLLTGQKHGYVFTLQNCTVDSTGTPVTKFQVTAVPASLNATGAKAFCSDETNVVRSVSRGSAQEVSRVDRQFSLPQTRHSVWVRIPGTGSPGASGIWESLHLSQIAGT
jgi:competence protein ComGC